MIASGRGGRGRFRFGRTSIGAWHYPGVTHNRRDLRMYIHSQQPFDGGIHLAFQHRFRINIPKRLTEVFGAALKLRADRNE